MRHLIDKSALVAEIERLISNGQTKLKESEECKDYESYVALAERIATCINVLSILDTLEVKEEPEFTVDDIMKIDALLINMWQSKSPNKYEEVLKQFKAQKGEEV